jgi:hypothetical protein
MSRLYYSDERNRCQSPLDIHDVLSRLSGVRELGTGKGWIALCPAHEDRKPSLRIAEGSDGRVLLRCFAGCSPEEIVRALGLELRDLFPTSEPEWVARCPAHAEWPISARSLRSLFRWPRNFRNARRRKDGAPARAGRWSLQSKSEVNDHALS